MSILAAENVQVTASSASGQPGQTVNITFALGNNPGTTMYELYIEYNSDVFEISSVDNADYYPEWQEGDISDCPLYISAGDALSMKNLTESKDLATVHFKIKEQAPEGEYKFSIQGLFLNADLDEYEVDYDDSGCISVVSTKNQIDNSFENPEYVEAITNNETELESVTSVVTSENSSENNSQNQTGFSSETSSQDQTHDMDVTKNQTGYPSETSSQDQTHDMDVTMIQNQENQIQNEDNNQDEAKIENKENAGKGGNISKIILGGLIVIVVIGAYWGQKRIKKK
jgi:hypothetical protein